MRKRPRRTSTSSRYPQAWGTCERSGFIIERNKLAWQFDWRGTKLENCRVLVAPDMLDKPQRQLGTVILPPDPMPIRNARPEPFSMEEPATTRYIQETGGGGYITQDGGNYVPEEN